MCGSQYKFFGNDRSATKVPPEVICWSVTIRCHPRPRPWRISSLLSRYNNPRSICDSYSATDFFNWKRGWNIWRIIVTWVAVEVRCDGSALCTWGILPEYWPGSALRSKVPFLSQQYFSIWSPGHLLDCTKSLRISRSVGDVEGALILIRASSISSHLVTHSSVSPWQSEMAVAARKRSEDINYWSTLSTFRHRVTEISIVAFLVFTVQSSFSNVFIEKRSQYWLLSLTELSAEFSSIFHCLFWHKFTKNTIFRVFCTDEIYELTSVLCYLPTYFQ